MEKPTDNEQIRHVMLNVRATKGVTGMVRDYDVLFTDNGIVFANTAGGLKSVLKMSLGAQFGVLGALAVKDSDERDKKKGRGEMQGLSIPQILEQRDRSFFIGYTDVQSVNVKKGLTGIGKMCIQTPDGKYNCEFPKAYLDVARTAVAEKLSTKVET
jgi:hypothetical protein